MYIIAVLDKTETYILQNIYLGDIMKIIIRGRHPVYKYKTMDLYKNDLILINNLNDTPTPIKMVYKHLNKNINTNLQATRLIKYGLIKKDRIKNSKNSMRRLFKNVSRNTVTCISLTDEGLRCKQKSKKYINE
jgi:hypothetical protein